MCRRVRCAYSKDVVCIGDDPNTTALLAHGGDQHPLVSLWIIALRCRQTLNPIEAATNVQLEGKVRRETFDEVSKNKNINLISGTDVFFRLIRTLLDIKPQQTGL